MRRVPVHVMENAVRSPHNLRVGATNNPLARAQDYDRKGANGYLFVGDFLYTEASGEETVCGRRRRRLRSRRRRSCRIATAQSAHLAGGVKFHGVIAQPDCITAPHCVCAGPQRTPGGRPPAPAVAAARRRAPQQAVGVQLCGHARLCLRDCGAHHWPRLRARARVPTAHGACAARVLQHHVNGGAPHACVAASRVARH